MDSIAAEFGEGKSLYEVLDVPSTATPASIKKAYFKLALKCVSVVFRRASPRFARHSLLHSGIPERSGTVACSPPPVV